jgi:D-sedoheptulose 7-phosphate isomerase
LSAFHAAMTHSEQFLDRVAEVARQLDRTAVERLAAELAALRDRGGRLFILGVGGSAGNSGHAVNDFRKLAGIEAYAPTDNVSELTARTNDEGWETVFAAWKALKVIALRGR